MSLLLDARKKSQSIPTSGEAGHASSGLSLEPLPEQSSTALETERRAGQNLFDAKIPSSLSRPVVNRNLLYAVGGTAILLAAGGSYVWYEVVSSNTHPLSTVPVVHIAKPPVPATQNPAPALKPIINQPTVQSASTANVASHTEHAAARPTMSKRTPHQVPTIPQHAPTATATPPHLNPQPLGTALDPLLNRAYQSYRNGKLEEAQQLYLGALGNDPQSMDALLGLAVIAQQQGDNKTAAQYYSRVLNLDPRNAVANAGMSALNANVNYESRLKTLLREQGNSAALHLALGNLYAEQSRWSEAQQAYFNAYTLDTQNANLAFNLAVSLDHIGQNKLAAEHYQRALQLDASNSVGLDHAQIAQRINELTH
jgi:Tfp pilus assembly protein PilF